MISTAFQQAFSSDENALKILQEHGRIKDICWRSRLYVTAGEILNCIRASRSKVASLSTYTSDAVVNLLGRELLTEASDPGLVSICRKVFLFKGKAFLFSPRLALYITLRIECEVSDAIRKKLGLTEAWGMLSRTGYGKHLAEAVAKVAARPANTEPIKAPATTEKPEIVEVKPKAIERPAEPKPEQPSLIGKPERAIAPPPPEVKASTVYADASVVDDNGARHTTIAAYCPELSKGFVRHYPGVALYINQAEMMAIALSFEKFPDAELIYSDNKNAVLDCENWRNRAEELTALEEAFVLRPVLIKGVNVQWIERTKNRVADYLSKWGGEARQGWVRVRQLRSPDESNSWMIAETIADPTVRGIKPLGGKGFVASPPPKPKVIEKTVEIEKIVEVEKVVEVEKPVEPTVDVAIAVLNQQIQSAYDIAGELADEIIDVARQISELERLKTTKREETSKLLEKVLLLSEARESLAGKESLNYVMLTKGAIAKIEEKIEEVIKGGLTEEDEQKEETRQPHLKAVA